MDMYLRNYNIAPCTLLQHRIRILVLLPYLGGWMTGQNRNNGQFHIFWASDMKSGHQNKKYLEICLANRWSYSPILFLLYHNILGRRFPTLERKRGVSIGKHTSWSLMRVSKVSIYTQSSLDQTLRGNFEWD